MDPWRLSLAELRVLFYTRQSDDLRCLVVRRECDIDEGASRQKRSDPTFLPWQDGSIDEEAIIRNHVTFRRPADTPGRGIFFRHVWFGGAGIESIAKFDEWADRAGMAWASRPGGPTWNGDRYSWIECVASIAYHKFVGSPLRTQSFLADTRESLDPDAAIKLLLPVNAFLSSVTATDTILAYYTGLIEDPAPPRRDPASPPPLTPCEAVCLEAITARPSMKTPQILDILKSKGLPYSSSAVEHALADLKRCGHVIAGGGRNSKGYWPAAR
ncbi:MAG TPA: hypothetical protein VGH33_20650 [Isosphaeraceae bacterium]|jgi:hypothetical protein